MQIKGTDDKLLAPGRHTCDKEKEEQLRKMS
jgi:hypothetical protein